MKIRLPMLLLLGLILITSCSSKAVDHNEPEENHNKEQLQSESDEQESTQEDTGTEESTNQHNKQDEDGLNSEENKSEKDHDQNDPVDHKSEQDQSKPATSDLTIEEAQQMVRKYLDIEDTEDTEYYNVVHDHDDNGKYVMHVFEVVGQGENTHTATKGWYYVDKRTGEVSVLME